MNIQSLSANTAARTTRTESGHWYTVDGEPAYTQIAKSTGLPRPTTLADARRLNLLPSVTTILKLLDKPALTNWLVEQGCLAVLTTPRRDGEELDAFVYRVLHTERIQDQEGQTARDRGTQMHAALEAMLSGGVVDPEVLPWIKPAYEGVLKRYPCIIATEKTLVGHGYAGKCDLIASVLPGGNECVLDFKSAKKLPNLASWWEHQLQTAAYLRCLPKGSMHANVYISTTVSGMFVIYENPDPEPIFQAFESLVRYWQIANNYHPEQ